MVVHENGWNVEYEIPYHCLRFSPAQSYTWGINVDRIISRKSERAYYQMVPRSESGFISRFPHLIGIEGIEPARAWELTPYAVGRTTLAPRGDPDDGDLFGNLGADLRYGISSGTSLNATINPDFGQVESDPAVLNLSVFETRHRERRPFFLEGSDYFKTPIQLFYSRRIGRRPGYFDPEDGWETEDEPDFTNILGAVKLTGKTAGKMTFGLLEAVTTREHARVESTYTDTATGEELLARAGEFELEPRTNFLVARAKQDIMKGNSHVGVLATALNRQDAESAYTGGLDWMLRWRDNAIEFDGQVAANRTETDDGVERGWASEAGLSTRNGWWETHTGLEAYADGFDINDLGFQWRDGYYRARTEFEVNRNRPWSIFQRGDTDVDYWVERNLDGVTLEQGVGFGTWNRFLNNWEFGFWAAHGFRAKDDLDTRGGPLIVTPAHWDYEIYAESDERRRVSASLSAEWGSNAADSYWRSIGSRLTIRVLDNLQVRLRPRVEWNYDDAQWVENIDDDDDGTDDHFVYGELKSKTLDLTTRANLLFSRDLSLEVYLQPFLSTGAYGDFKELARPASYEFAPHPGPEDNPDFRRRSLRGNVVLRWEYSPGSVLFVVWSQSREDERANARFKPSKDLWRSFTDAGTDVFLVKLNYWWNR